MIELELLFENGITRDGLKAVFNPYRKMKSYNDDFFFNEIFAALERKVPYEELKILPFYTASIDNNTEKNFSDAITKYLSFSDGMPFYPKKEDWMKKIAAPEDFIKQIFPESCVELLNFYQLDSFHPEFNFVFQKKIQKMEELEKDNHDEGLFEFSKYNCYFMEYFSTGTLESVKKQWEKYLTKEFEVARRFQYAWENKDHFYAIAKEKNLSVDETMMLFIDYAFEDYDELIK